ncbi:MAG: hypothetical protein LBP56_09070 [Odoribacteraceae bacterium]|jgi:hypothetical protein|nr:hypothetical protein [Odoribacteraceae bacterium]
MDGDSLQILLYILAVIGAIVMSGVKSYRKFKQQDAGMPPLVGQEEPWPDEEEHHPLEEVMRQFTRGEGATPQPEVHPNIDLVRYQEVATQRKHEQERDRKLERDRRFASLFRDNEQRGQVTAGINGQQKEFDLKEAIIYSEIIHRKYE